MHILTLFVVLFLICAPLNAGWVGPVLQGGAKLFKLVGRKFLSGGSRLKKVVPRPVKKFSGKAYKKSKKFAKNKHVKSANKWALVGGSFQVGIEGATKILDHFELFADEPEVLSAQSAQHLVHAYSILRRKIDEKKSLTAVDQKHLLEIDEFMNRTSLDTTRNPELMMTKLSTQPSYSTVPTATFMNESSKEVIKSSTMQSNTVLSFADWLYDEFKTMSSTARVAVAGGLGAIGSLICSCLTCCFIKCRGKSKTDRIQDEAIERLEMARTDEFILTR